jgi:hypothetical protein
VVALNEFILHKQFALDNTRCLVLDGGLIALDRVSVLSLQVAFKELRLDRFTRVRLVAVPFGL